MVVRAWVPLVPRPAVLPLEASPRPTRVFAVFAPGAGRRWCSFRPRPVGPASSSAGLRALLRDRVVVLGASSAAAVFFLGGISVHLLHAYQVAHGLDHAAELRLVRLEHRLPDPLQAQRAQRVPLRPRATDL